MKKILLFITFFLIKPLFSNAHIGSDIVVQEGVAGQYKIQVFVEPPDVIPGTAKVSVMLDGADIKSVKMSPIFYWTGDEGSPRSDEAVQSETGTWEGSIWLMESGAASVKIMIEGARGKGETLIPIAAISTAQRELPKATGWLLAILTILLVAIMTTIIGASTGDSLLKIGEKADSATIKKRIVGSVIGASFCGLLLFGGNTWWNAETEDYKQNMYRPYTATSTITETNSQRTLKFKIDSASIEGRNPQFIIPDHGKLMHMFLIRQSTMEAFAHIHPKRLDSLTFTAVLPDLPVGKYLVYADVLRYHSLQNTIADTVEIKDFSSKKVTTNTLVGDSDDTFVVTNAIDTKYTPTKGITSCGSPGVKIPLQDGSSIIWEEKPNQKLLAGKPYSMKFSVETPDGKPAELQTYLGMLGHAAVVNHDGSVYIHLHPNGTFSNTAVQVMQKRIAEDGNIKPNLDNPKKFSDSIDYVLVKLNALNESERDKILMEGMAHQKEGHHGGAVSFPYVFPKAGNYRIWLQVKRNGNILTGVFDVKVE
jgi:hypothetical protein